MEQTNEVVEVKCPYCQHPIDNKTLGKMWGQRMKPLMGHRKLYNRFALLTPEERKAEAHKANQARWDKYRAGKTAKAQAAQKEMAAADAPKAEPTPTLASFDVIDTILKGEKV